MRQAWKSLPCMHSHGHCPKTLNLNLRKPGTPYISIVIARDYERERAVNFMPWVLRQIVIISLVVNNCSCRCDDVPDV
jgi:hypothetical protein